MTLRASQRETLVLIWSWRGSRGPTTSELAVELGVSRYSVYRRVAGLQRAGLVMRDAGIPSLTPKGRELL